MKKSKQNLCLSKSKLNGLIFWQISTFLAVAYWEGSSGPLKLRDFLYEKIVQHIQKFRTRCKTPLGTNPKSPKLFESSFKTCLGYPVNNTKASSLFELEMLGLLSPRFCLIYWDESQVKLLDSLNRFYFYFFILSLYCFFSLTAEEKKIQNGPLGHLELVLFCCKRL